MRRRKKSSMGSLDSLLDTLTNVVGILVILLAVTQLGVEGAVNRIRETTATISKAEFDQKKKEFTELQARIALEKAEISTINVAAEEESKETADVQKDIASLKAVLDALAQSDGGVAEARKLIDQQKAKVVELQNKMAADLKQIDSLQARIDETPPPPPPPKAKIVYLPNPQVAPKGLKVVEFVCQNGRIVPLNVLALRKNAQREINRATKELKESDGSINCQTLKQMFEDENIGNGFFRLKIKEINHLPQLVVHHRETVGDTALKLRKPASLFQDALRNLDRKKQWIRFLVYPDSFETYLSARTVVSRQYRIAAGWVPKVTDAEYRIALNLPAGIYCSGYKPPPPQPAPKKTTKKTTSPVKPAPTRPRIPNDDID